MRATCCSDTGAIRGAAALGAAAAIEKEGGV